MLFRSHLRNGRSIIGLAKSEDGLQFRVAPDPFRTPAANETFTGYEDYGVEDPRICPMDGEYLITCSACRAFLKRCSKNVTPNWYKRFININLKPERGVT